MKIICIGQAAYDITLPVNLYPSENSKIKSKMRVECGGGSAATAAYLLSLWKEDVYFAGTIGKDEQALKIASEFSLVKTNLDYLEMQEGIDTPTSYIINSISNGSRTVITYRNDKLKKKSYTTQKDFDVVYLDGYEKDYAIEVIKKNPQALKIIDAGKINEDTLELCHMVDYIICSKDFAEQYTKLEINNEIDAENACMIIKKTFPKEIIITLEDKGSFTLENGAKLVPSIIVDCKDSTGAGDIFHGAFTYFITHGNNKLEAMRLSNITAALSTEKIGTKNSMIDIERVIEVSKNVN